MFLNSINITKESLVSDIVSSDYRTADVLRKYGIEYCCGGKWPLEMACKGRGLDTEIIMEELNRSVRNITISNSIDFSKWDIDFLIDYIINVHHEYIRIAAPQLVDQFQHFANDHQKKFPYLTEMERLINHLVKQLQPHLQQEEEIIFPYIKQIAHAFEHKESYAGLFVRTLRKPVESIMEHEHENIAKNLLRLRELSNNYTPPDTACISHKTAFLKLKEFDTDLVQHMHLENDILFPKGIKMEKDLLQKKD
ncbi:MAG: DUF542 domain-containing protein [Bacteroidota bacterium]